MAVSSTLVKSEAPASTSSAKRGVAEGRLIISGDQIRCGLRNLEPGSAFGLIRDRALKCEEIREKVAAEFATIREAGYGRQEAAAYIVAEESVGTEDEGRFLKAFNSLKEKDLLKEACDILVRRIVPEKDVTGLIKSGVLVAEEKGDGFLIRPAKVGWLDIIQTILETIIGVAKANNLPSPLPAGFSQVFDKAWDAVPQVTALKGVVTYLNEAPEPVELRLGTNTIRGISFQKAPEGVETSLYVLGIGGEHHRPPGADTDTSGQARKPWPGMNAALDVKSLQQQAALVLTTPFGDARLFGLGLDVPIAMGTKDRVTDEKATWGDCSIVTFRVADNPPTNAGRLELDVTMKDSPVKIAGLKAAPRLTPESYVPLLGNTGAPARRIIPRPAEEGKK